MANKAQSALALRGIPLNLLFHVFIFTYLFKFMGMVFPSPLRPHRRRERKIAAAVSPFSVNRMALRAGTFGQ
ncbi:hypothetical protein R1T15_05790 [Mucilaginibacter sp. L3T2-6]|uniref:hypothetical protein n=1 Tax=Mucilaginibacter sp. L3T2-6 TaxID=3062491 RepID=UPI002949CE0C|nr:hypothetical protein [Mucilaginibacter sp. L3T2-6]MDV6213996.1 hypothetical protein [Mucilaginibacter sp. L3T2-6]